MCKKVWEKRKGKWKGKNTYFRREGGHKTSLAELGIVQIIHEPLSLRNAIPLQLVLGISHGK